MPAGLDRSRAEHSHAFDLIPNAYVDLATTTGAAKVDLAALPYRAATATYRFTGVDTTEVPADTVVVIDGVEFTTDDAGTITDGEAIVAITASALGFRSSEQLYVGQSGVLDDPITDVDNAGEVVTVEDAGASLDAKGKRVWLRAITQAASVLRGDHEATLASGEGVAVGTTDNPTRSFYVDVAGDTQLTYVAAGAGFLRVMFSDDL